MPEPVPLLKSHERNIHSQGGEDGIIERIFATLGLERGTAVEFGAWDGVHLSNTAHLREQGWRAVLIEGDAAKIPHLRRLADERTRVVAAMVVPEGSASLDAILDAQGVAHVDFLSIDIDGDDIHILSCLKRRPRVICIEFNPTIPPPYSYVNPRGTLKGSSLVALCEVATRLDYRLVYATYCNAFFVASADAAAFVTLDPFRAYHNVSRPAVFALFDGAFDIANASFGQYRHAWSTLPVYVPRLPRILLGWPPSFVKVVLAYLYSACVAPFFYVAALIREGVRQARARLRG